MAQRDKASDQLKEYKKSRENMPIEVMTTSIGAPIGNKLAILTAGPRGPLLMQDFIFEDDMSHFQRERIPERVVHAKGAGAFGYFEVTNDITMYSKAKLFESIGKKTKIAVRFSTVGGESGSADTVRDPRGFAVKFYTEQGNWDLVGNNTPIFFIRDPILFPSFVHTQKRNPVTHLKDPDAFWDFISLRPETLHQVSFLFSDRGIPDGYRHMNGYGSHTFKLVNAKNEAFYCKFHYKTNQGIKCLHAKEAAAITQEDPDYAIRDLYNTIAEGKFPSWTFSIQVMTFEQAEKLSWNPFDLTKIWPHSLFPPIPVGKLVLNRNPNSYFAEVEQIAFSPAHMVPGIEASPCKMLQGRLYSYADTHRHRLGTNYQKLPVNQPIGTTVRNYQRDGPACDDDNQVGAPNYFPNSFGGPSHDPRFLEHRFTTTGDIARYESCDEDNYSQVATFWSQILKPEERRRLVENIGNHLKDAQEFIQNRTVAEFSKCHPEYGEAIEKVLAEWRQKGLPKPGQL